MWASSENSMWKFREREREREIYIYIATRAGFESLPPKVAMVLTKGNLDSDFAEEVSQRKLAMVCAKGTLDFREEVIDSVMKVILDDAHVATHLMTPGVTGMPARSGE